MRDQKVKVSRLKKIAKPIRWLFPPVIWNFQKCEGEPKDYRAEQCAAFNDKPFEGVYYEWVPHTIWLKKPPFFPKKKKKNLTSIVKLKNYTVSTRLAANQCDMIFTAGYRTTGRTTCASSIACPEARGSFTGTRTSWSTAPCARSRKTTCASRESAG